MNTQPPGSASRRVVGVLLGIVVLVAVCLFALLPGDEDPASAPLPEGAAPRDATAAGDGTGVPADDDATRGGAPARARRGERPGTEAGEDATAETGEHGAEDIAAPEVVTLRVLGPDGKAVANASVTTLIPARRAIEETTKKTGADGRVSFEDLELAGAEAFLVHAGSALAAVVARPQGGSPDLVARLVPAVRVAGRVERVDGTPLEGARCTLLVEDEESLHEALRIATSDERGVVEFPPIPVPGGALKVSAYVVRYGVEPVTVVTDVTSSGTFVVRPREPRIVRGRCIDSEGRPVAGAWVRAGPEESRTAADGTFRWVGPDPNLTALLFDSPSHAPVLRPIAANGDDVDFGDIRLTSGATVRGTVTDASGRSLPHVMVWAHTATRENWYETWSRRAFSAANGTFEIAGLPAGEEVEIGAFVPTLGSGDQSPTVVATAGDAGARVVATGCLAALRFVRDAGGTPLDVTWSSAQDGGGGRGRTSTVSHDLGGASFGVAVVRFDSPGRHVIRCRAHRDAADGTTAYYVADEVAVVVEDGTTADVEVRLKPQETKAATSR